MNFENINLDDLYSENIKLRQAKNVFSTVGLAIAILAIVRLITQAFMVRVIYLFFPAIVDLWWTDWLISSIPLYAFALPIFLLVLAKIPSADHNGTYVVKSEDDTRVVADKPKFGIRQWILFAVASIGVMYVGSYIGQAVMGILSVLMNYDYSSVLGEMVDSTPILATVIMACIIAPIGEELLFRKLIIDKTRAYGDLPSILLSASAFALFHMNYYQFFYALFIGIILSYIYTLTGKLRWCIALHAFVNFIGSVAVPQLISGVDLNALAEGNAEVISQNPWSYVLYLAVSFAITLAVIAAIIVIIYYARRLALSRGSKELPKGQTAGAVIRNGGIIFAALVLGALFAMNLLPVA